MSVIVDEDQTAISRSIITLLQGVLDAVVSTYASAGIDLPDRRYWLLSEPVVDCEQVTVSLMQAYVGPPGDEASLPQRCDAVKTAVMQIQVHRCVPTTSARGKSPTAAAIQGASEALAIDAFLLLDSANALEMWDISNGPGLGVIATVEVLQPQGGYQAVLLNLTTAIP